MYLSTDDCQFPEKVSGLHIAASTVLSTSAAYAPHMHLSTSWAPSWHLGSQVTLKRMDEDCVQCLDKELSKIIKEEI